MADKHLVWIGKPEAYVDNLAYFLGAREIDYVDVKDFPDRFDQLFREHKEKGIESLVYTSVIYLDFLDAYKKRYGKEPLLAPFSIVRPLSSYRTYQDDEKKPQFAFYYPSMNQQRRRRIEKLLEEKGYEFDLFYTPESLPKLIGNEEKRGFNVRIFLLPGEVDKTKPYTFGRRIILFSPEEISYLNRADDVIVISRYLWPKSRLFIDQMKELGYRRHELHSPESIPKLRKRSDLKDWDVIVDDPSLLPLVKDLDSRETYYYDLQRFSRLQSLFIGSPSAEREYQEVVKRFGYTSLGAVPPDEKGLEDKVRKLEPDLIIVEDLSSLSHEFVLEQLRESVRIVLLSEFAPRKIGNCRYVPHRKQGLSTEISLCPRFVFDHEHFYPYLFPLLEHPPDRKREQEWVASHPTRFQGMAADLIRATQYVSFKDFHRYLRDSVVKFAQRIKDRPFIILVRSEGETREKSNYWVAHLVWDLLLKMGKEPVDVTDSLLYAVDNYPDVRDFVITDDASYSGTQLHYILQQEFVEVLNTLTEHQNEIEMDEIKYLRGAHETPLCDRNKIPAFWELHLIVPFMSEEAQKVIPIDCRYTCYVNMYAYPQVIMKRLSQLLDQKRVDEMIKAGFIDKDKWPYYFSHKVADYASSYPAKYLRGEIIEVDQPLRFVSNCLGKENENCYEAYYKAIWD
jgi:hypothetical protein